MKFSDAFSPGRAITAGLEALKRAPIPILIGALLLILAGDVWYMKGRVERSWEDLVDFGERFSLLPFFLPLLVLGSVFAIIRFLFTIYIFSGYLQTGSRVTRGEGAEFESIFLGAGRFFDLLLWEILRHLINTVALMVLAIPVIPLVLFGAFAEAGGLLAVGLIFFALFIVTPVMLYVDCGLYFGAYRVAIDKCGPIEALKDSWQLADGNRLWLIGFRVLMFLFSLLGLFALGIGYVVTRAIADMGFISAYMEYTRGPRPQLPATVSPAVTPTLTSNETSNEISNETQET